MAYVDLNLVRASISETLHESEFTSIQARIRRISATKPSMKKRPVPRLMPFGAGKEYDEEPASLPFDLRSYIELKESGKKSRVVWSDLNFIPERAALPVPEKYLP